MSRYEEYMRDCQVGLVPETVSRDAAPDYRLSSLVDVPRLGCQGSCQFDNSTVAQIVMEL